ncbi:MAG TPA: MFS transporter [Polyangiaceae bacterium]|nr:MFS transporter [Polyangiaceae bacterium]
MASSPPFHPNARAWLIAAALVGTGQQTFVVLRNQYLLDLGLSAPTIASVQGVGGAAGIAAGLLGLWGLRRFTARVALAAGVAANALGFAIQAIATQPAWLLAGAAAAGLGIQGLTMIAAPFLTRQSSASERVRLFATHTIAIQALPGAAGALIAGQLQRVAGHALGSPLLGYRVALAIGCAAVLVALLPLARIREARPRRVRSSFVDVFRLRHPRRAALLLTPDVIIFFGSGLTIPFLQLYFKERFTLGPAGIGGLYAVMMLAGGVGHLLSPRLARRYGTWPVIIGSQLASLPFFGELLLAHAVPFAATAFVLRQAVMNVSSPLVGSFLHSNVVDEDSGPLASYRMLAQSVAWAGANFLAGPLMALDKGGFRFVIAVTMASYVVGVASGVLVYPRLSLAGREASAPAR